MTEVLRALRDVIVEASGVNETALPDRSTPIQDLDEDEDE
jgi:GTP-binding protein